MCLGSGGSALRNPEVTDSTGGQGLRISKVKVSRLREVSGMRAFKMRSWTDSEVGEVLPAAMQQDLRGALRSLSAMLVLDRSAGLIRWQTS